LETNLALVGIEHHLLLALVDDEELVLGIVLNKLLVEERNALLPSNQLVA